MIYRLVRGLFRAGLFGYFRRIDVEGLDRVPAEGPVLLVANHVNAFVDALLVVTRLRRPVTLTAKATLRADPLLRPLLGVLRVVTFRRGQDEASPDPGRNRDAFEVCRRRLEAGEALCVFPEGVSHSDPGLRPFRTGAARIALDFVARSGGPLPVVPVALHYEAKDRFRSAAGLIVGEPLDAESWVRAHPGVGARELTDEIDRRIRSLTANFDSDTDRTLFVRAAELLGVAGRPPVPLDRDEPRKLGSTVERIHRLQAGAQRLGTAEFGERERLEHRIGALYRKLGHLGITARELSLPIHAGRAAFFVIRELEILLVGLPLAGWGALNHFLPYRILRALVDRVSEDADHVATNAVFFGIPLFLLAYAVQAAAVAWIASPVWALGYAVSLPLSGAVALLYRDRAGGVFRRTRTFLLFLRHPEYQRSLEREARSIVDEVLRLATETEHAAPRDSRAD